MILGNAGESFVANSVTVSPATGAVFMRMAGWSAVCLAEMQPGEAMQAARARAAAARLAIAADDHMR